MIEWRPKKRQCRATGCSNRFLAHRQNEWWCSPECGAQIAMAKLAKHRERQAAADRRAHRIKKQSAKPRRKLLAETQAAFNAWIRERDWHLPCVSCGRPNDGNHQRHAGHYKPVGSNPTLRFDPDNCHAQCSVCNNHLSGNLLPYRAALPGRIGAAGLARLEGPQDVVKWPIEELEAMKKQLNAEARRLARARRA